MRFTIQRLAEMLGISQSTIRRYEDRGIIQIKRDDQNGYRYYSLADAVQLSIYLSMSRQLFTTQDLLQSRSKGKIQQAIDQASDKLVQMDKEIERLYVAKRCWARHLSLLQEMQEIQNDPHGYCEIDYPEIVLDLIGEEQTAQQDSLYFSMVRQNNETFGMFRLCNIFTSADMESGELRHQQAFYVFPQDIPEECAQRYNLRPVAAHRYIAVYDPHAALIDDEQDDAPQQVRRVHDVIRQMLAKCERRLGGDVVAIAVAFDRNTCHSILLIPVEE